MNLCKFRYVAINCWFSYIYITDYHRKTATSMVITSFLNVWISVTLLLCVGVKNHSLTVPRTARNSQSRFSSPLEQIPASRRMNLSLSVESSGGLKSRKLQKTTSSCQTTFQFFHSYQYRHPHRRHAPGRHLPALLSSRREIRVG